jgi:hypothetical protein
MNEENGTQVEDPILERLDAQVRAGEELAEQMGLKSSRHALPEHEAPPPYDLEPEAPRALSLAKLLKLSNTPIPPDIAAATGNYEPVVLLHGLTPFHPRGRRPTEIWGMGYEAQPLNCDEARTVAFEPRDRVIKTIEVQQSLAVDVALDGRMTVGTPRDTALPLAAGLSGTASTRQGFAVSLQIEWSAVEVQAGPVGNGGVRWNLYRQASRIDRHHRLLQTILIPRGTKELTIEVKTWVRRRGGFFGVFGTHEWRSSPRHFSLTVESAGG